ncbi:hypothetical protein [Caulobacter sp. BK020]|uniref:hypothetical protein n=1 Tax=Caulobacter sp. BK020 TaxID=2512117 RepID=UPI0010502384|nr:hypothetical protein [Caulobacter sp. BK020]TCS14531.1 hypothetical protein EV278_107180 [Caulobacter sp. BK020]
MFQFRSRMSTAARLPFQPHRLTLRACADLGLRVSVGCPSCRMARDLNLAALAGKPLAALPLGELLQGEALKCRRGRCHGVLASSLCVTWQDVGILRTLVEWRVWEVSGSRAARLVEPPAD